MESETVAGVTSEPGGEYDLIAQEVESAEYRRRVSSTYTTRASIRGLVLHMLRGPEACTEGAMIHKAAMRRNGHKGGTEGAPTGVDVHVGSTVKARVKHVIDRGEGAQSARHLVLALVLKGKSNSRLLQGAKGRCS